jgi:hypothetical protein
MRNDGGARDDTQQPGRRDERTIGRRKTTGRQRATRNDQLAHSETPRGRRNDAIGDDDADADADDDAVDDDDTSDEDDDDEEDGRATGGGLRPSSPPPPRSPWA